MSCSFEKEILYNFIDNNIDPLELIFLSEHLKCCNSCEDELNFLFKMDRILKDIFKREVEPIGNLNNIAELVVNNLCEEDDKFKKLRKAIVKPIRVSSLIINRSSKFLKFMPSNLIFKSTIKKISIKSKRKRKRYNFYPFKIAK